MKDTYCIVEKSSVNDDDDDDDDNNNNNNNNNKNNNNITPSISSKLAPPVDKLRK